MFPLIFSDNYTKNPKSGTYLFSISVFLAAIKYLKYFIDKGLFLQAECNAILIGSFIGLS